MKKRILLVVLPFFFSCFSFAEEEGPLDAVKLSWDPVHLQHGARTFINYCLNCHSASGFRYADLQKIGLTKQDILTYLAPGHKISDFMISSMPHRDAAKWFGDVPPDLSWEARARGADWIYTYLKSFYRDNDRPNGWNNTIFPSVNMPHVFYDLQGQRSISFEEVKSLHDDSGHVLRYVRVVRTYPGDGSHTEVKEDLPGLQHFPYLRVHWKQEKKGLVDLVKYDETITDLVSFMAYMAEPSLKERETIGFFFLVWLLILSALLYVLKSNFWKDIE